LEEGRMVNAVLFDKTGTLTTGEFGVTQVLGAAGVTESEALTLTASVNAPSEHPIARAIVAEAHTRRLALTEVKNFQALRGRGVSAELGIGDQGSGVIVGNARLMAEYGADIADDLQAKAKELETQGKTVVWAATRPLIPDSRFTIHGFIALADTIRSESREAVGALKAMGMQVLMITGDTDGVARRVSAELEINEYFAHVLPGEKSDRVKALQERGLTVAMVGDGINDAPALAQANLGVAIGAGTNVAIESAGIVLVRNDPRDIARIIRLSRATYRKMLQNLFWATGYNVIALPLAAGAFARYGIVLGPALSALLMSLSTVIVAINALALKRKI
ncbi:MAG: HAD-IC family P-type ATPase, partial [bacterium]|nr:HAD-IC family P-type ATPase [bacterium]